MNAALCGFDFLFAHVLLTLFPAFAELCAVTVLAHALFRHAGTAYVVSIIAAFMMFMNHELGIVQYPPAMFSFPVLAYPSELPGWDPWMSAAFGMGWIYPSVQALAANSVENHEQGSVAGAVSAAQGLGTIVGPITGTFVYEIHVGLPYVIMAGLLLLIATWKAKS